MHNNQLLSGKTKLCMFSDTFGQLRTDPDGMSNALTVRIGALKAIEHIGGHLYIIRLGTSGSLK